MATKITTVTNVITAWDTSDSKQIENVNFISGDSVHLLPKQIGLFGLID